MAADLIDLKRLKITEQTKAWLTSECLANPELTVHEIAREALHEIAVRKIRAAKILAALSPGKDHSRDGWGRR